MPPKKFNENLWDSFQHKTNNRSKIITLISSIAASLLLFISLIVFSTGQKNLNYEQKKVLLEEALDMFPKQEQTVIERNIIYENEMIVVYTTLE